MVASIHGAPCFASRTLRRKNRAKTECPFTLPGLGDRFEAEVRAALFRIVELLESALGAERDSGKSQASIPLQHGALTGTTEGERSI